MGTYTEQFNDRSNIELKQPDNTSSKYTVGAAALSVGAIAFGVATGAFPVAVAGVVGLFATPVASVIIHEHKKHSDPAERQSFYPGYLNNLGVPPSRIQDIAASHDLPIPQTNGDLVDALRKPEIMSELVAEAEVVQRNNPNATGYLSTLHGFNRLEEERQAQLVSAAPKATLDNTTSKPEVNAPRI